MEIIRNILAVIGALGLAFVAWIVGMGLLALFRGENPFE